MSDDEIEQMCGAWWNHGAARLRAECPEAWKADYRARMRAALGGRS